MKTNLRSTTGLGAHRPLTLNALSACMALVMPAIAAPAWAQCDGQVLPPNSNCAANVSAGVTVTGTTINSTGTQTVSAGGTTVSSTINSGGKQTIMAGGADTQAVINSGGSQNVTGSASWTTVNIGGKQTVSSGGATSNVTVNSGGTQTILVGASDNLTMIMGGGTQLVAGTASNTTIVGKQTVSSGGSAIGATVNSGGTQTISAGGAASNALVNSGGLQTVAGTAQNATLNGGKQNVSSGGVAGGTIINNGGVQTVSAGGSASGAVVNSGGVQTVAGGVASGTVVNSGGSAAVTSGGTATNTVVNAFARQTVTSGVAIGTILVGAVSSGGTQYVSAGGSAIGTVVGQKARQTVYAGGTATSAQVTSGGTQTVSSGGQAINASIANGGMQQVAGGGVATGSVIDSGATAMLFVGGTTPTGTLAAPVLTSASIAGTLQITTTSSVVVTGNANAIANALVLNGGTVTFTPVDSAGYKTLTINGLSGSGTFNLNSNIAAGQADHLTVNNGQGSYVLYLKDSSTTPAAAGTRISIVDGTNNNATFSLPGGSVDVGAEKYALQSDGGQIYLFDTGRLGDAASISQALPSVANMIWYEQLEQTYARLAELRGGLSQQGLWVRVFGERMKFDSNGVSSTADAGGVQFGRDLQFGLPFGNAYVGIAGGVAQAKTTVGDSGTANSYPWNIGLYGGLAATNGWFADSALRFLSNSNDFTTTGGSNAGSYHVGGFMASLAGGRRFSLPGNWTVEPRAALTYLHANSLSYAYDAGMPVQLSGQDSTLASLGVTVSKPFVLWRTTVRPYVSINGVHAFSNTQTVTVAGTDITAQMPANWITASAGMYVMLARGMRVSADVNYAKGQNYTRPFAANVAFSYQK